jgi:hypothetical protein
MFLSQYTSPEIHPAVVKLSTKYDKVTKEDTKKTLRVAEYLFGGKESHKLVLKPKKVNLIRVADASHAEHPDGKSHSHGIICFESDTSCYFGFVSPNQPVIVFWRSRIYCSE